MPESARMEERTKSMPIQRKADEQTGFQGKFTQQNPYGGKPLPISGKLAGRIRDSFGIDAGQLSLRESPDVAEIGAAATAQGNVIRFAPGEFRPDTGEGMSVLGHELNHVREQAMGGVRAPGGALFEHPVHEAASDRAGAAFAGGSLSAAGPESLVGMSAESAPVQGKKKKPSLKQHRKGVGKLSGIAANASRVGQASTLGSSEKYDALFSPEGVPSTVTAMNDVVSQWGGAAPTSGMLSNAYQANTLRENGSEAGMALKDLRGNAFSGLSEDISDYMKQAVKGGVDLSRVYDEANSSGGVFKGMNFKYSDDVSALSKGPMDIMSEYLNRESIQEYLKRQYKLLDGSALFEQQNAGSALDFLMGNLYNREFGLQAFSQAKTDEQAEVGHSGISAVNSMITRLPNLARDLENGTETAEVPDHMQPLLAKYRAERARVGAMVDPARYAQPEPEAAAPAGPAQGPLTEKEQNLLAKFSDFSWDTDDSGRSVSQAQPQAAKKKKKWWQFWK